MFAETRVNAAMATRAVLPDRSRAPAPGLRAPEVRLVELDRWMLGRPEQVARWDALAQWAAEPNPFFESWYLLPALRAFDRGASVRLLCLEADGQLAGLVPLRCDWSYYGYPIPQWSVWLHANCFLAPPLVAQGFEGLFWTALLEWLDAHAGPALFLHLSHLPLGGALHRALLQVCAAHGRQAALVKREQRAMLTSPLAPDAYFEAALGHKKRKELRRQHRRLAEEGDLAVRRRESGDGIDQWLADFLALERSGWKGRAGSALGSAGATETLFRQALAGAAARGRLERIDLTLDGRPIAMLANFLTPPGAFSFKTAFDERFARYSPGVLLQRENLAMLERPGIEWTDSCAATDHPMIDRLWRERRTIGRVNVAIGGPARRALFGIVARGEAVRPAGEPE